MSHGNIVIRSGQRGRLVMVGDGNKIKKRWRKSNGGKSGNRGRSVGSEKWPCARDFGLSVLMLDTRGILVKIE